jgi:hypothetical protein
MEAIRLTRLPKISAISYSSMKYPEMHLKAIDKK